MRLWDAKVCIRIASYASGICHAFGATRLGTQVLIVQLNNLANNLRKPPLRNL